MQSPISYTDDLTTGVYRTGNGNHCHSNCEFLLETSGSVNSVVNGTGEQLVPGDIRFINTSAVHALTDLSDDHEHYDVYISNETLRSVCEAVFDLGFYDQLTGSGGQVSIWTDTGEFTGIVSRLTELDFSIGLNAGDEARAAYAGCLKAIIIQMLGHCYEQTRLSYTGAPKWMVEFLRSLKVPEVFSMNLEEIIAGSCYSHTRFCALFKQYFGKSFKDYISELRINYACAMLISTDSSILDIALAVGYSSASHFIKRFKEETGVSPRVYRSRHLR